MTDDKLREAIQKKIYPYLAGLAGGLTLQVGWSETKQKFLEATNREISDAIASLVEREKIKARIDEVGVNMTIDSERLNNKRLTELRKELENLDKQV